MAAEVLVPDRPAPTGVFRHGTWDRAYWLLPKIAEVHVEIAGGRPVVWTSATGQVAPDTARQFAALVLAAADYADQLPGHGSAEELGDRG